MLFDNLFWLTRDFEISYMPRNDPVREMAQGSPKRTSMFARVFVSVMTFAVGAVFLYCFVRGFVVGTRFEVFVSDLLGTDLVVVASIILILAASAVLPVLLFVFTLGIWAVTANYRLERRLRSRMRRCGRFLRIRTVSGRIAAEGGTLIIENPSFDWNFTHAWWTPENASLDAPCPMPSEADYRQAAKSMKCLGWDKWCWENYTSPDSGRAFLVRVCNGASLEAKLSPRFPDLQVVRTWTALVHFQGSPDGRDPRAT
jgi:hypothetical protein